MSFSRCFADTGGCSMFAHDDLFHAFLIKYAEIGIKGKNRYLFEDALL